jgi:MFS family permease
VTVNGGRSGTDLRRWQAGRTVQGVSRRGWIVALAVAAQMSISLIQFGLPALTFALKDDLGIGPARYGVLFATTGVGPAAALVVAGRLCDVVGARRVLVVGSAIGSGGLFLASSVHGFYALCGALLVSGLGAAAVPVAGMTAILAQFPPERRGRLLGVRQMAVPAGGFVAAGLLPALHDVGGLRLAFAVPAGLVLVCGLGFAVVVGSPADERIRPAPLAAAFTAPLRRLMLTGALYVTGLGGVLAFAVDAAHAEGLTRGEAGLVFAVLNVGAAAARVVWGLVADSGRGTRRLETLAGIGLIGCVSALVFPLALRAGIGPALAAAVLLAFGTLGFNGVVYLVAGEVAGVGAAGSAVGATSTVVFLVGSVVGPPMGLLVEHAGYGALFAVIAVCVLLGSACARTIAPASAARA